MDYKIGSFGGYVLLTIIVNDIKYFYQINKDFI